jgi:virginiamycin A acetyltransferase
MSMTLGEKEDCFLDGSLRPTTVINEKQYTKSGQTSKISLIKNAMFEAHVSMRGEIIAAPRSVFIGSQSYMNNFGYLRDHVFIGRYCSIGRRVTLGAGAHNMTGLSTSPIFSRGPAERNYGKDEIRELELLRDRSGRIFCIIRSDVWIGDGAVVLAGVTIGVGAVIGANAVVTRDVAPYSIVVGAPAKEIRRRFPENIRDALLTSEWWEMSTDRLRGLKVGNIFEFLEQIGDSDFLQDEDQGFDTFEFETRSNSS